MTKQCSECVSGVWQVCVSQPEIKNPRPARNSKSATSPKSRWDPLLPPLPRHPCCKKWYGAHFFHDASDEKPVSPCVARVIKFHFRGCFVRKACVGPQCNCYDLRPCCDYFARSIKRNACVRSPAGACYDLRPPLVQADSGLVDG